MERHHAVSRVHAASKAHGTERAFAPVFREISDVSAHAPGVVDEAIALAVIVAAVLEAVEQPTCNPPYFPFLAETTKVVCTCNNATVRHRCATVRRQQLDSNCVQSQ